jgi:hypothetical protein
VCRNGPVVIILVSQQIPAEDLSQIVDLFCYLRPAVIRCSLVILHHGFYDLLLLST